MQDLQVSDVQLQRMVADEELALPLEDDYLVAEVEPAEQEPVAKIGFEDFDPSKDLGEAAQNLPAGRNCSGKCTSVTCYETNADVIVEAINTNKYLDIN